MRKLKFIALILVGVLFLTGCGCSKRETTYTVRFDTDGGNTIESVTVKSGEQVSEPNKPVKEGYIFGGWYLNDVEYTFNEKVTSDIVLKARWAVPGEKACTLTCNPGYELINGDSSNCECKKIESSEVAVTGLKLNVSKLSLVVGNSSTIVATVTPSDATDKTVVWTSSNNNVAKVQNGKVTAVGTGSATITATVGGKESKVVVTVISKDKNNLNNALKNLTPITLTKGNTSLEKTYNNCTIVNKSNVVSSNASNTVVTGNVVTTLYRPATSGTITSTYEVTCGSEKATKSVEHVISASTYKYTATDDGMTVIIKVKGATNYTLSGNLKYRASLGGAQTSLTVHKSGNAYKMTFDNDQTTIYEVVEEN